MNSRYAYSSKWIVSRWAKWDCEPFQPRDGAERGGGRDGGGAAAGDGAAQRERAAGHAAAPAQAGDARADGCGGGARAAAAGGAGGALDRAACGGLCAARSAIDTSGPLLDLTILDECILTPSDDVRTYVSVCKYFQKDSSGNLVREYAGSQMHA